MAEELLHPRAIASQGLRPLDFSLGPGRSYQAVADRYGVSKRAVTALAKRENWQARLAAGDALLERKAVLA